jgi:DNA-binding NtrC family response regulator
METSHTSVLIVDDDELVRDFLFEVLRHRYEVVVAGTAEEALRVLGARDADFAAALVDVNLPGMSGGDLVTRMRSLNSEIAVIVMSGEPMSSSHHWWALGIFAFLAKPLEVAEVERYVELALESRTGRDGRRSHDAN